MYFPRKDNELDTLCNYLDVQLDALRASAFGLDDDAARRTPLRSALSISGLLKHATFVMVGSLSGAGVAGYEYSQADFAASFTPTAEETLDRILERFDCVRADYMEMCRGGDLEVELPVGPFPWYGMDEPQVAKLRYIYVHAVEESPAMPGMRTSFGSRLTVRRLQSCLRRSRGGNRTNTSPLGVSSTQFRTVVASPP